MVEKSDSLRKKKGKKERKSLLFDEFFVLFLMQFCFDVSVPCVYQRNLIYSFAVLLSEPCIHIVQ